MKGIDRQTFGDKGVIFLYNTQNKKTYCIVTVCSLAPGHSSNREIIWRMYMTLLNQNLIGCLLSSEFPIIMLRNENKSVAMLYNLFNQSFTIFSSNSTTVKKSGCRPKSLGHY